MGPMKKVLLLSAVLAVLTWRSGDVHTATDYLLQTLAPLIH